MLMAEEAAAVSGSQSSVTLLSHLPSLGPGYCQHLGKKQRQITMKRQNKKVDRFSDAGIHTLRACCTAETEEMSLLSEGTGHRAFHTQLFGDLEPDISLL